MRGSPPEGFVDFVVARGPALHRTAVLLTRQHASAEDLVQTALAKAWRAWGRIEEDREAYVRRIIVNEFASGWRRRWRGEVPTADLPETAGAGHDDQVTLRASLVCALASLPHPSTPRGRGGPDEPDPGRPAPRPAGRGGRVAASFCRRPRRRRHRPGAGGPPAPRRARRRRSGAGPGGRAARRHPRRTQELGTGPHRPVPCGRGRK